MPPLRPGPRNLITDVDGILVGQAEDRAAWTGTTVILPESPAVAAVDVRGGGPGTRETEALAPSSLVEAVHGIVLSGGSAFGLEAAAGAMQWLAEQGRGFAIGAARVPIVPAAILFDLLNGGAKAWGDLPPYRALGRAAAEAAGRDFALGNAGAGYGAKAGRLKGGLGSVSAVAGDGLQVGALVAVNALGSTVMPGQGCFWAWALEQAGELGGQRPPQAGIAAEADLELVQPSLEAPANTTIGVVATNAALAKGEVLRVAIMAQDGYARAIRPSHSPFDGDTVFALATGRWPVPEAARARTVARIGAIAADCVARAVARGVYRAETLGPWPCWRERHGMG